MINFLEDLHDIRGLHSPELLVAHFGEKLLQKRFQLLRAFEDREPYLLSIRDIVEVEHINDVLDNT